MKFQQLSFFVFSACFCCASTIKCMATDEVLTVLGVPTPGNDYHAWIDWNDGGWMLIDHLNRLATESIDQREESVASLRTSDDWRLWQQKVRRYFDTHMGPWPEKTPLNVRVTGTIERETYLVEKIVFESTASLHVTGAVFLPANRPQTSPAILKLIGHSDIAFRKPSYQNVILNLVHKGFIVLAIDPIGQGERLQYYDSESNQSLVGRAIDEHTHAGVQCFLVGRPIAHYFVWDAIRAIDYLASREDVDADRIGVTGLSGGGVQSSYVGAIDPRVAAVAPMGFVSNYRRLLESIGVQCGEQVFYRSLVHGIDHADLLTARAPKPTLHVTTTRDFFSIQGARETEREVRRAYRAFNAADAYDRIEDDHEHGFTVKNNEGVYAFFQRTLGVDGDPTEHEYEYLTERELQVTETGQVSTSYESETVFSINRREARSLLNKLEQSRRSADHLSRVVEKARLLSGFLEPGTEAPNAVFRGRYPREGYVIEKWGLSGEGETILPVLLFLPDDEGPHPAIIYADADGKASDAQPGQRLDRLAREGHVIAAVDLLGFGETRNLRERYWHGPTQAFFTSQLFGRSVVSINAGDILRVHRFLQTLPRVNPNSIGAYAKGATGPAAIHAVAFAEDLSWLVLEDSILDYSSVVLNPLFDVDTNSLVAGFLKVADLPDLIASIAPRKVVVITPRDHLGQPLSSDRMDSCLAYPKRLFRELKANDHLITIHTEPTVQQTLHWATQTAE